MTLQEIADLTVNDVKDELLFRLEKTEEEATQQELDDELVVLKQELTDAENARIAEEARRQDIEDRMAALSDLRMIVADLGKDEPNLALYKKRILDEDLQAELAELEAQNATTQASIDKEAQADARRKSGKAARACCEDVLDIIAGINIEDARSAEDIDALKAAFSAAHELLKDARPVSAKAAIAAITPDALVTQDMLDAVLDEFSRHGL
jgi:hypothetical protein